MEDDILKAGARGVVDDLLFWLSFVLGDSRPGLRGRCFGRLRDLVSAHALQRPSPVVDYSGLR